MHGWDAWIGIGTGALAVGTFVLARVTSTTAAADRHHDDEKRAEDRARDDRLRKEQLDQLEQREQAERIALEDYEARQVLIHVEEKEHPSLGHNFNRRVILSTPHAYPIKWVDGCLVHRTNGGLGIIPFGHSGDAAYIDDQRIYYLFWAEVSAQVFQAAPIMRFVDWHGNLYYQYRHYTQRFSQNTDWSQAAQALDEWIRTGPKPD
jgi:hypothetical protein